MMRSIGSHLVGAVAFVTLAHAAPGATPCEDLAQLKLPDTAIDAAQDVAAGDYNPAGPMKLGGVAALPLSPDTTADPLGSPALHNLPAFCRIHGIVSPVPDSRIGFELWMPKEGWNRRLLMLGNGGYSSTISFSMATELKAGYATLGTDTGHSGDAPDFAIGHPEAIVDWAYRAVHESTVKAKPIVSAFFGQSARYTYFAGCSTGGHQGFTEAQRYPEDFNGILAGDPGHNRTHINAGFLWQYTRNHVRGDDTAQIIPSSKLAMISGSVLSACRANNGSRDGGLPSDEYLDNPVDCEFDPSSIRCRKGDAPNCLTEPQVVALQSMYDGAHNPRTGERIYFGWQKGSESAGRMLPRLPGWSLYWADPKDPERPARVSFWRYWAFSNPSWSWWSFDFDHDMALADQKLASVINAMNPDLTRFREHGGKMIHYHGLADQVVPLMDSISYHERVVTQLAHQSGRPADPGQARREVSNFYRLFLVPGMEHCQGGPGPDAFDALDALQRWVEGGVAPDRIVATRFAGTGVARSAAFKRPLCPFPQQASFRGDANPSDPDGFVCVSKGRFRNLPELGADYLD